MTYFVQTNIQTNEIGIDSKDRLYETLQLHGDSAKFKNTRIVILSEGAYAGDSLVSDIKIDYTNQRQDINTYSTSDSNAKDSNDLYTNLNESINAAFEPLGLIGSSYERVP